MCRGGGQAAISIKAELLLFHCLFTTAEHHSGWPHCCQKLHNPLSVRPGKTSILEFPVSRLSSGWSLDFKTRRPIDSGGNSIIKKRSPFQGPSLIQSNQRSLSDDFRFFFRNSTKHEQAVVSLLIAGVVCHIIVEALLECFTAGRVGQRHSHGQTPEHKGHSLAIARATSANLASHFVMAKSRQRQRRSWSGADPPDQALRP